MKLTQYISLLAASSLLLANLACGCAHPDLGSANESHESHAMHESHAPHESHAEHHAQAADTMAKAVAKGSNARLHECSDLLCEHATALCADCTESLALSLTSKPESPSFELDAEAFQDAAATLIPWTHERPFRLIQIRALGERVPAALIRATSILRRDQLTE